MSLIWTISDPHLFHLLVSGLRGFDTPEDWNEHFATHWRETVRSKDQVWILGDLTAGGHLLPALDLIQELPGQKHLIMGNHDRCHPLHRDSHRSLPLFHRAFDTVQLHSRRRINGINTLVSHLPYLGGGDHTDDERYAQWRLIDCGLPLLHGHTHSSEKISRTGAGTLQVNLSWEAWGRLVQFDELLPLLTGESQGVG